MKSFSEYEKSRSVDELIDLLEVIYRIAELKGVSKDKVELMRKQKNKERGGFSNNLYLLKTY